jgi:hypothetical protein
MDRAGRPDLLIEVLGVEGLFLDVQGELQDRIGENAERLFLSFRHRCRVHEQNKNIDPAQSQVLTAVGAAS